MLEAFFDATESMDMSYSMCLLYGIDDETKRLDITQFINDGIISIYYKHKNKFFQYFLKNIEKIYPHAIHMTINILSPIIYDDLEARNLLSNSLDSIDSEKIKIFKEIYLLMIEEDEQFYDEKIMEKLENIS